MYKDEEDPDDLGFENLQVVEGKVIDADPSNGPLFDTFKATYPGVKYSVSLIKDMLDCPAKAYGRITRQPQEKGYSLIIGSAVHAGMETHLKQDGDPYISMKQSWIRDADRNGINLHTEKASEVFRDGVGWLDNGIAQLSGRKFLQSVDPELVEVGFDIDYKGRLLTGKMDFVHFEPDSDMQSYAILDFKTNKNSPNQFALDTDLQFSTYGWAAYYTQTMKTHGIWMTRGVWFHLRGKKILAATKTRKEQRQYSFPTQRTLEGVTRDFVETIEPAIARIERNDFQRIRGDHCTWCSFFNKEKQDCGVDLPTRELIHAGDPIPDRPPYWEKPKS